MLHSFRGAIFDMDGTLIDSLCIWNVIWDCFGKLFLNGKPFQITKADDKVVRTMTLANAMDFLHSRYSIGESGTQLLKAAEEIMADFYKNQVKLKKGVDEFLEFCYRNQIKMCIASATDKKLLNLAMEHCGLKKYFDLIISCAEIGKGKDEPDVYIKALECLGTSKEETWIFEDSHVAVETASHLGLKTVGIYDENNYDTDKIKEIATVYIEKGETLLKLL